MSLSVHRKCPTCLGSAVQLINLFWPYAFPNPSVCSLSEGLSVCLSVCQLSERHGTASEETENEMPKRKSES